MSETRESTCQHCGREVVWSPQPKDAGYAAFVHLETATTACPVDERIPQRGDEVVVRLETGDTECGLVIGRTVPAAGEQATFCVLFDDGTESWWPLARVSAL